jgi:hypothetical protein
MRHVNSGMCVEFGPVEKAVKGFLVFFIQDSTKPLPPFPLLFQNKTEGHDCLRVPIFRMALLFFRCGHSPSIV